jgi:hypothetical protein
VFGGRAMDLGSVFVMLGSFGVGFLGHLILLGSG